MLAVVLSVDVEKLQSEKESKQFFKNQDFEKSKSIYFSILKNQINFVAFILKEVMFAFTLCLFTADIFPPFHFLNSEAMCLKFVLMCFLNLFIRSTRKKTPTTQG